MTMPKQFFRDDLTADEWIFMVAATLVLCIVLAFLPDSFKVAHLSGRLVLGIAGVWSLWFVVAGQKPRLVIGAKVERLECLKQRIAVGQPAQLVFQRLAHGLAIDEDVKLVYLDRHSGLIQGGSKTASFTVRVFQDMSGARVKVSSKATRGLLFAETDKGENERLVKKVCDLISLIETGKADCGNEPVACGIEPDFCPNEPPALSSGLFRLTYNRKLEYFQEDLKKRGVNKLQSAPPIFKVLWKLGVKVPPPIFLGFRRNSLLFTSIFSVFYLFQVAPLVALSFLKHQGSLAGILSVAAVLVVVQSLAFGVICATYLWNKQRKLNLPRWEDYNPTTSLLASGSFDTVDINDNNKLAA